jgi:1-acyl-sn-glycerol-3-phosphate acyltransferase
MKVQLMCLIYLIYDLVTGNKSMHKLVKKISLEYLKIKSYKHQESKDCCRDKCIYLFNHVSWCDFFYDTYLTYAPCFISWNMVIFAVPMSIIYGIYANTVLLIALGKKNTAEILIKKIKNMVKHNNLLIYPEGKRNTTNKSLRLKLTVVNCAFENNIPLQIVMVSNKDKILNEKLKTIEYNVKSLVYYSKVFYPENYKDIETLKEDITSEWLRVFDTIHLNDFTNAIPISI